MTHRWQNDVDELQQPELMGKTKGREGVELLEAEEFSFAPSTNKRPVNAPLDEIKAICGILQQQGGSKEDFFALFTLLRSKYPELSPVDTSLNEFITEHLPFELTSAELVALWD
ncbi:hypothetical protein DBR43_09745 [Pedobacter sp. KBW06]|nr:hypothetical protein DBR43_09745 [Pedobacter sp. KBW06]